jgi:hypothetical protein
MCDPSRTFVRVVAPASTLSREAPVKTVRSSFSAARAALGLACLLACAAAARAQRFSEFGGGWNYSAPSPGFEGYSHGYNFRVSLGHQLEPRVRVRFDAIAGWFDERYVLTHPPCPSPPTSCSGYSNEHDNASVAGLSANWLVNVDPRGILYGIGGAGLYDVNISSNGNDVGVGVSAGAGISVPVSAGLRAFVETRYHVLFGTTAELPWIVPVTLGIRF